MDVWWGGCDVSEEGGTAASCQVTYFGTASDKKDRKEQIEVIYDGLEIRGARPETDALQGWLVADQENEDKLKTFAELLERTWEYYGGPEGPARFHALKGPQQQLLFFVWWKFWDDMRCVVYLSTEKCKETSLKTMFYASAQSRSPCNTLL